MTHIPRNQDFEAYAEEKPINYSTNPVWEGAIQGVLASSNKSVSDLIVLDNGCGDGKLFPNLVRMGFSEKNIHGVEVSQKRVTRCHQAGFENARYLDLHEPLPYSDLMFDIVNYLEVIEHVPAKEIDFYLTEMVRVMKPSATAIITTPNYPVKRFVDIHRAFTEKKWDRLRDDSTHVTFYTHHSLRRRLERFFHKVDISPYKQGVFYSRLRSPYLMHKMIAICQGPRHQS